jgi:GAF domain-containing protein
VRRTLQWALQFDGELIHQVAQHNFTPKALEAVHRIFPAPPSRALLTGRAILERAVVHIPDVQVDPEYQLQAVSRAIGFRSGLFVPMLREGAPIGVIVVGRAEAGPFSDNEIELLKTFADQAVIAVENVRLFTELEARNLDLSVALDRQTATSEVLRVIGSSPTDAEPVFDAIVGSAVRLLGGFSGAVLRLVGDDLHLAAITSTSDSGDEAIRGRFPRPLADTPIQALPLRERAPSFVSDTEADPRVDSEMRRVARARGYRSMLVVPMLREDSALGVISVTRREPGPFADEEIALLQTFADQAVIAIENVRLFKELEARNAELTEALEQQTATSEILRVISSSPTDLQPVLDAIAASAARLCDCVDALVFRIDGDVLQLAASHGPIPKPGARPIIRGSVPGRAVLDRRTIHVHDLAAESDSEWPEAKAMQKRIGHRTILATPLLREGVPLGAISIRRMEVRPFSDKQIRLLETFADQAVIAIENVRLFTELQASNRELTTALDQQTATSDILRVISSSPTDVQPVFDTIVRSAVRLCDGLFSALFRFDGELIHHVAQHNYTPKALEEARRLYPARPSRGQGSGRAVLERAVVNIPDIERDLEYQDLALPRAIGFRSGLFVPMLREGVPLGVIAVARAEPGPFSDNEIELLKTFADQAVIAIENVRLFKELEARNDDLTESLEQQTATADILRVISASPTEVQPVFEIIAERAMKLCEAEAGVVSRLDGELIHLAAIHGWTPEDTEAVRRAHPMLLNAESVTARTIRNRAVVHIQDVLADPLYEHRALALKDTALAARYRLALGVPMVREGQVIGAIFVARAAPGQFSDRQVALLKTFADQAVIAIENVRLFKELAARNRDLTVALEQQTATSEILRVISSSQTDVQPVFETMAANALRLCDAKFSAIFTFDGELIHLAAHHNVNPDGTAALRDAFPMPPGRGSNTARAILTCSIVHIPDVREDSEYLLQGFAQTVDYRSILSVPMLRDGQPIGVISVGRAEARPFPDEQVELLKTFADQALIAIENVRLFKELQARTNELTRSVDQLTALGEISQAVSSTLDVETVLQTIVSRASQLAGADGCAIYEYDDATEAFHIRATHNLDPVLVGTLRAAPLRKGEGAMGRAAETREPTQIADIAAPGAYQSHIRETLLGAGYRALLSVPLLREGEVIGSLSLNRHAPGEFPPAVVEVLKTFATQSALAIQNARLFREIADKSRQLEAASRHKSEFLANMSHELRTPLNAIIGFSEVLVDRMFGELNEKQDEYLKDIYASGQHLLSLINDILDLSKIEAGRMELEATDFDLPSAIDNALTLVRERATRRGITLGRTIDAHLGMLRGDERKVKQVLLNLLSNALKFTPEGGRIDVRAGAHDEVAEVSVTDTGVGIAPEDQEAVFEEFRQVGTADKKVEGTGLGLALSRKFIELHGGRIWVTSTVGVGSTFTFTLPVRREG